MKERIPISYSMSFFLFSYLMFYSVRDFDQVEFFEGADSFLETSMDKNGYVFVPDK